MSIEVIMADGAIKRQGDSLAPQGVVCHVWRDNNQAVTAFQWNTLVCNRKQFDPYNWYDPATGRFTPKIAGYYRCGGSISMSAEGIVAVWKNGIASGDTVFKLIHLATATQDGMGGSTLVYLNGTTDYVELRGYATSTTFSTSNAEQLCFFDAELIGMSVGVVPEPWHVVGAAGEPGFANGWVNFGGGLSTAAFFKDPHGVVHLKGEVMNGTAGTSIFTLPVGYRPSERLDPACGTSAGASFVTIGQPGTITPTSGAGNSRVCLDAITFRAEQ